VPFQQNVYGCKVDNRALLVRGGSWKRGCHQSILNELCHMKKSEDHEVEYILRSLYVGRENQHQAENKPDVVKRIFFLFAIYNHNVVLVNHIVIFFSSISIVQNQYKEHYRNTVEHIENTKAVSNGAL
jgi:hypothetical protein